MECKKDGSGDVTLMAIFLFVFKKWAEHPLRMMLVVILALSSALSDILIPVFAADFVNVLTQGGSPFLSFFMMMG
ncbi:TPA: ABC transporter ATP-binding protein, partial [Serratia marcescens]